MECEVTYVLRVSSCTHFLIFIMKCEEIYLLLISCMECELSIQPIDLLVTNLLLKYKSN